MNIRLLTQDELDRDRWNGCVHYAPNGNLFGYKWFLDQVGKDWEALVEDEYHSVFPLIYRQDRWGRKSLHQPALMRELGIYSVRALSPARIHAFMERISDEYTRIEMQVNGKHRVASESDYEVSSLSNYYLDLTPSYEELSDCFSAHMFSKLDRAQTEGLLPLSGPKPEKIAAFVKRMRPEVDEHALMRVMYNLLHRGWGFASAIHDREGNWLAADFFGYSHGRVTSLAFAESTEGQEKGAAFMLYNLLLRSHAGRPLTLDFNHMQPDFPGHFQASEGCFFKLKKNTRWLGIL